MAGACLQVEGAQEGAQSQAEEDQGDGYEEMGQVGTGREKGQQISSRKRISIETDSIKDHLNFALQDLERITTKSLLPLAISLTFTTKSITIHRQPPIGFTTSIFALQAVPFELVHSFQYSVIEHPQKAT
jgi:hypothetical protein